MNLVGWVTRMASPDFDRLVRFYDEAFDTEVTFVMAAEGGDPRIIDLGLGACLNVFHQPIIHVMVSATPRRSMLRR